MTTRSTLAGTVVEGDFTALQGFNNNSHSISLYLSSTFTDMCREKKYLQDYAYPQLRKFCAEKGFEFQVVDMKYGITEDYAKLYHLYSDICEAEITECKRLSRGLNFIALVGDKYGSMSLPHTIEAGEFEKVIKSARKLRKDTDILTDWFAIDDNIIPKSYTLLPFNRKYPLIYSHDPQHEDQIKEDFAGWLKERANVVDILREAAEQAHKDKILTETDYKKYTRSYLEKEVEHGLLSDPEAVNGTLCFVRKFNVMKIKDRKAAMYTDLKYFQQHLEPQVRLKQLRDKNIPDILNEQETTFEVNWEKGGINLTKHHHYLTQFCSAFVEELQQKIEENIEVSNKSYTPDKDIIEECAHHVRLCSQFCKNFNGREDVLSEIKEKMSEVHNNINHISSGENDQLSTAECLSDKDGANTAETIKSDEDDDFNNEDSDSSDLYNILNKNGADSNNNDNQGSKFQNNNKTIIVAKEYDFTDLLQTALSDSLERNTHQPGFTRLPTIVTDDEEITSNKHPTPKWQRIDFSQLDSFHMPVIINGSSGSGKTTLLAEVMNRSNEWFPDSVRVVRFIGTSTKSKNIETLLIGLCEQLCIAYNIETPEFDLSEDFNFLVVYFHSLLRRISSTQRHLVISLDAIELLIDEHSPYDMNWLPLATPENVHLIVTVDNDVNGCFDNLSLKVTYDSCYVNLAEFHIESAKEVFDTMCRLSSRKLSPKQCDVIFEAFAKCPHPLFLKLSFFQSLKWNSFTRDSYLILAHSVKMAVLKIFNDLERVYGGLFIRRLLGYMSISLNGLTDLEMEDLLSLDDDVLQYVYRFHAPRNPKMIRIPTLIWKQVKHELRNYITEQNFDGRTVIMWNNQEFSRMAKHRYVNPYTEKDLHAKLAEYYSGVWNDQPKSFELNGVKKGTYPDAYRCVTEQPLLYGNNKYNVRKLAALPYHLILSHQFERFLVDLACNFDWLFTKMKAQSMKCVLKDFELSLVKMKEMKLTENGCYKELQFIHRVLQLAQINIKNDSSLLATQIIGQLGPSYSVYEHVEKLVAQSIAWCHESPLSVLVPVAQCLPFPQEIQLCSLTVNMHSLLLMSDIPNKLGHISVSNDGRYLCAIEQNSTIKTDIIKIFDLSTNGQSVETKLLNVKVKSVKLIGERFIEVCIFDNLDPFQAASHIELYNRKLQPAFQSLPQKTKILSYSKSLRYMAAVSNPQILNSGSAADEQGVLCAVIDMATDEILFTMSPSIKGKAYVNVIFSSDGSHIIATTWETHEVFSLADKSCINTIPAQSCFQSYQTNTPQLLSLPGNHFLTRGLEYGDSQNMYIYNYLSSQKVAMLSDNEYAMDHIVVSQSGALVAACTADKSIIEGQNFKWIYIWSSAAGTVYSICKETGPYMALVFCDAEDNYLLSCSQYSHYIQLWFIGGNMDEGIPIHRLNDHCGVIFYLLVSPDQQMFFSSSEDNTLKVWCLEKLLNNCSALVGDWLLRIKNSKDDAVDENETFGIVQSKQMKTDITTMAIIKSAGLAAVTTIEGWLIFLKLETGVITFCENVSSDAIPAMIVTKDEKYCIVATTTGIKIWSLADGEFWCNLPPEFKVSSLAESNNILVAGVPEMFSVCHVFQLDAEEGPVHILTIGGLLGFELLAINSTGTKVISTISDFPVVFDLESGSIWPRNVDTKLGKCTHLSLSSNDRYVGASSTDGSLRILDLAKSRYRMKIMLKSTVRSFVFACESDRVITGGFQRISIWSLKTKSLLYTFRRHEAMVNSLKLIANGNILVSASDDQAIVVWDLKRGRSIGHYRTNSKIKAVSALDDGSYVIYPAYGATYLGIVKPNPALQAAIEGNIIDGWPDSKKRAVALVFSELRNQRETTEAQLIRTKTCIVS